MIAIETKDLSEVEAQKFLADIGPFPLARGAFPEFAWTPGAGFLRAGFWPFNFLPGVKTHRYPDRIRVNDAKPPVITVEGHGNVTFLALANRGREPVGYEIERAVREIARRVGVPFPAPKAVRDASRTPGVAEPAPAPDAVPQAAAPADPPVAETPADPPVAETPPPADLPRRKYEDHPLAALFPLLDGPQLDELAEDIRANGLRDPITLYEDRVIDGRNRLRACEIAGVDPRFEAWQGEGDPLSWVISKNLHRRHLRESQRAMVAAKVKPLFEEQAKIRQAEGGRLKGSAIIREAGKAATGAALLLNVSPRSVESATKVLKDGIPELARAVETGKISVSAAAAIVDRPADEQRALVAGGKKAVVEAAAAKRAKKKRRQSDGAKGRGRTPSLAPIGTLSPQEELVQLKEALSSLWERLPGEDERKQLLGVVRKFYEKHAESAVNPAA